MNRGPAFDRLRGRIAARCDSGGECESEGERGIAVRSSWRERMEHG